MGGCAGTPQTTPNPNINQNNYAKPVQTTEANGLQRNQQRPSPIAYQPQTNNNSRPATANMRDTDNDIPKVLALESTRQIKRPRRNL